MSTRKSAPASAPEWCTRSTDGGAPSPCTTPTYAPAGGTKRKRWQRRCAPTTVLIVRRAGSISVRHRADLEKLLHYCPLLEQSEHPLPACANGPRRFWTPSGHPDGLCLRDGGVALSSD